MKPIDIRDANWATLRQSLQGRLAAVYQAWLDLGPATTRQLAEHSGIDILNVRPRTTDLCALGLVHCIDGWDGEGIYAARPQGEWERWCASQVREPNAQQLML